jgi:hypothetical protein
MPMVGYAQTWGAYEHGRVVAWVYRVGLIHDSNSYERAQLAGTAWVKLVSLH